jgi:hypothetical protein
MLELSPDETKEIIRTKPVFPYSREQVENMTKADYRKAFAKWEQDRYGPFKEEMDKDTMYQKFYDWNRMCLNDTYEDELEHLSWLCDKIANGEVRNMDMESTAACRTTGIYFNAEKRLMIISSR